MGRAMTGRYISEKMRVMSTGHIKEKGNNLRADSRIRSQVGMDRRPNPEVDFDSALRQGDEVREADIDGDEEIYENKDINRDNDPVVDRGDADINNKSDGERSALDDENGGLGTLVSERFFSGHIMVSLLAGLLVTALVATIAGAVMGLITSGVFVLVLLVYRIVFPTLVCTKCGARLSAEAKQCIHCAQRHRESPWEFVELPEIINPDELYTIRTFHEAYKADMSRDILAREGIVAFVPGVEHRSIVGIYGSYIDIPLKVHGRNAKEAMQILLSLEQNELELDESEWQETGDPDRRLLWGKTEE